MIEERIEKLEEMLFLLQARELVDVNQKISESLMRKGIKLRKYKWQELEAS